MSASAQSSAAGEPREEETRRLRAALGVFPTGIVVVTAWDAQGGPLGMTMNSFTSLSLRPPLVLFSIDRGSLGLPAWLRARGYAMNVLARGQEHLSNRFARALSDKWQGVACRDGLHQAPLLSDALATFECAAHATFDGGDHVIFVARVERFECGGQAEPLVFHRGRYTTLASHASAAHLQPPADWPLSIHY